MVDALHRARDLLSDSGVIIDMHPTPDGAVLMIGGEDSDGTPMGILEAASTWERHANADAAVKKAAASGALIATSTREFWFRRYGESVDELAEFVRQKWTDAYFTAATVGRARHAHGARPELSVWFEERVRITRLEPAAAQRT